MGHFLFSHFSAVVKGFEKNLKWRNEIEEMNLEPKKWQADPSCVEGNMVIGVGEFWVENYFGANL